MFRSFHFFLVPVGFNVKRLYAAGFCVSTILGNRVPRFQGFSILTIQGVHLKSYKYFQGVHTPCYGLKVFSSLRYPLVASQ